MTLDASPLATLSLTSAQTFLTLPVLGEWLSNTSPSMRDPGSWGLARRVLLHAETGVLQTSRNLVLASGGVGRKMADRMSSLRQQRDEHMKRSLKAALVPPTT